MLRAAAWLIAMSLVVSGAASGAEMAAEKRADIRQLIGATGGHKLGAQIAETTSRSVAMALRTTRPDIPDRFYTVMGRELAALFEERIDAPGGLIERLVEVYDKHFTHAEVRELLAFYRTPIGRKSLEVLPALTSESMAVGQAWGQSLGPEIRQRLQTALQREKLDMPRKK